MPKIPIVLIAAALVASPALAGEDAAGRHARSLAAGCANCHGGERPADAAIPSLTGMPERDVVRAMEEYRAGTRAGTVMPQIAKGYTDAQIGAIARWYANAKR